jgi:hypothetical protein
VTGLLIRVTGSCSVDLAFDLAPKDTHLGIRLLTGCFGC